MESCRSTYQQNIDAFGPMACIVRNDIQKMIFQQLLKCIKLIIMQPIYQQKELPRFSKDFIGIGHHLQERRKERRKVEQQERIMANRVLFLQNQQFRAQKSLYKKKIQLSSILRKSQRQFIQRSAKERQQIQRQKEIQMAKEQNRLRKLLHRQSRDYSTHLINEKNSLDYKIIKKQLVQGQHKKKMEMVEDLTTRKRYMTLNMKKEQGRSRIDKFFKDKNKQHTSLYKEKIYKQQNTTRQKKDTIQKLGQIEEVIRKKLEQSSLKVSQMQNLIGNVSSRVRRNSMSRASLNNSPSFQHSPVMITSMEEDILLKEGSNRSERQDSSQTGRSRKINRRHKGKFSQYIMN